MCYWCVFFWESAFRKPIVLGFVTEHSNTHRHETHALISATSVCRQHFKRKNCLNSERTLFSNPNTQLQFTQVNPFLKLISFRITPANTSKRTKLWQWSTTVAELTRSNSHWKWRSLYKRTSDTWSQQLFLIVANVLLGVIKLICRLVSSFLWFQYDQNWCAFLPIFVVRAAFLFKQRPNFASNKSTQLIKFALVYVIPLRCSYNAVS